MTSHRHRLVPRFAGAMAAFALTVVLTGSDPARATADGSWRWPVDRFQVVADYQAPAHPYAGGHRGVDVRPLDVSGPVRAPAQGVVAFTGRVADRGVLTIDHGDGLVTTLEPVDGSVPAGWQVAAGDPVGTLGAGGHAPPGSLHIGVRLDGEYINPLVLLGGVPRAVLLPCC